MAIEMPRCGKCGLEMSPENAKVRPELFLHDACLPEEFRPKVRQPQICDILTKLLDERGAIVSSADCSVMELAFARSEGRFYVDLEGFGFVLRPRKWRENAEAVLHKLAELTPYGPCGMRNHATDCDCGGAGGDR